MIDKLTFFFPYLTSETASTLEAESGYSLETPLVTEFRQAVLNGEWTKVSDMLPGLGVSARDLAVSTLWAYSHASVMGSWV